MADTFEMSAGPLHIEPANESDVDDVISIIVEVAHWLHSRGIDQWWPTDRFKRRQPWIERAKHGELYLARLSNAPIATLTIQWEDVPTWGEQAPNAGYIHRLAVRRVFAGKGIGRALLSWAEESIKAKMKEFSRLDCWAKNTALRAYYESVGYALVKETKVYGYDTALYEKPLGRF